MSKPVSRFAIAIWIAAAVVGLINAAQVYLAVEIMTAQSGGAFVLSRALLAASTNTITSVVMLAGFGWLIELVDQIRWNTRRDS